MPELPAAAPAQPEANFAVETPGQPLPQPEEPARSERMPAFAQDTPRIFLGLPSGSRYSRLIDIHQSLFGRSMEPEDAKRMRSLEIHVDMCRDGVRRALATCN